MKRSDVVLKVGDTVEFHNGLTDEVVSVTPAYDGDPLPVTLSCKDTCSLTGMWITSMPSHFDIVKVNGQEIEE